MSKLPLTTESVVKGIKQARASWIDSVMKEHLPSSVYAKVHAPDPLVRQEGLNWVKERGYRTEDRGEELFVFKGTKELARTKMMLELESAEDLRALAKTARLRQNENPQ